MPKKKTTYAISRRSLVGKGRYVLRENYETKRDAQAQIDIWNRVPRFRYLKLRITRRKFV